MANQGKPSEEVRIVPSKVKEAVEQYGQMSLFGEAPMRKPTPYEKRMMILLNVKSPEELERVLSEPPDEKVLETMGPPYELYDLEAEDDLINDGLYEIEDTEKEGTDAIFVTKGGGMAVIPVPNPAPSMLRMIREFSRSLYRILPEPEKFDRCNWVWLTFVRRGSLDEFLIYEEMIHETL